MLGHQVGANNSEADSYCLSSSHCTTVHCSSGNFYLYTNVKIYYYCSDLWFMIFVMLVRIEVSATTIGFVELISIAPLILAN